MDETRKVAADASWSDTVDSVSRMSPKPGVAAVFKILANGSASSVKPIFGACRGILVSDRATVFSFWSMSCRQICWAHLLRKFVLFSERDGPAQKLGEELLDYTALIFGCWHALIFMRPPQLVQVSSIEHLALANRSATAVCCSFSERHSCCSFCRTRS